ncbi:6,7-dimethyl-8-ribityllumazine synthase [Verrucomicrobia bacterium]|nr:6,7-dimethyl-8-ribityllumazine synthase [Verrucomicrobiota bacterium]
MLKKIGKGTTDGGGRYGIVASEYNPKYVDGMLKAAKKELQESGAETVTVVRVPGAFEIPVVAATLASGEFDAVICLGVILKGETSHADHIGSAVTDALALIQIDQLVPVVHEVLVFDKKEQAVVRCLDGDHNRGREAAQTAIKMVLVMKKLT